MEFRPPKVKRISRFRPERSVTYPLSIKNIFELRKSKEVIGKYNGSNVVIDDPDVTVAIYNLGCFGKGSLSRGEPNYYLREATNQEKLSSNQCTNDVEKSKQDSNVECSPKVKSPGDSETQVMCLSDSETQAKSVSDSETQAKSVSDSETQAKSSSDSEAQTKSPGDSETNVEIRLESHCPETSLPVEDVPPVNKFQLHETLHLNLEEAYFLCYGLGCLQVVDLFDKTLSLQEAWELFCESQDDFVQKYVVYHYYRTKGWVVKPGLKFGGDFVLYKWGVNITHASYIVIIEVIKEDGHISEDHQQPITWNKFIGLNRMAETAGKEVLLCRVVWPNDVLFKDVHSPEDIKKFGIEEILTKRWVSSQERELLENEELE